MRFVNELHVLLRANQIARKTSDFKKAVTMLVIRPERASGLCQQSYLTMRNN